LADSTPSVSQNSRIPPEAGYTRTEVVPSNSPHTHRNWFHEAFYSPDMGDTSSDDEGSEIFEEGLSGQARAEPGSSLHYSQDPSLRLSAGHRRTHGESYFTAVLSVIDR
jgi:hypothetical protein